MDWQSALQVLKQHWGYDRFRPPQDSIVKLLLEKRDALVVLPTGFGKSLCFQVPAILGSGVTLVVSPLIGLMEEQVNDLRQRQLPAAALHSEIPTFERKRILNALEQNRLRLLYVSPETLLSPPIWQRIQSSSLQINGLMIDEAHTLVHWGETFRPDYRRLGAIRPSLNKNFAIAAFTATADPNTQRVLDHVLKLRYPQVINTDPLRDNLQLSVRIAWTPKGRQKQVSDFIAQQHGSSGLVFVRTRSCAEELATHLSQQGAITSHYHGGIGSEQRRQIERRWLDREIPFLVCTNAFGMGINKPDVRWILHFHAPPSLTDYVQEVGRSGRDGQIAKALLLVSEPTGILDPTDQQRQDFFRSQAEETRREALKLLQKLPSEGELQTTVDRFGKEVRLSLAILHQIGCLQWTDPFHFRLNSATKPNRELSLKQDPIAIMQRFVRTQTCRWQFILDAFGYAVTKPCQVCDNCIKGRLI